MREDRPRRFLPVRTFGKADLAISWINRGEVKKRVTETFRERDLDGRLYYCRKVSFWRQKEQTCLAVLTLRPLEAEDLIQAISDTIAQMAAEREAVKMREQGLPAVLVGVKPESGHGFVFWKAYQADLPAMQVQELTNWLNRRLFEVGIYGGRVERVDMFISKRISREGGWIPLVVIKARSFTGAGNLEEAVGTLLAQTA